MEAQGVPRGWRPGASRARLGPAGHDREVLTYGLGGISGAFFNPAICVASWMHSSMGGCGIASGTLVKYSLVQVLGAILGSVGASLMCHGSMDLTPSLGFGWFRAGLCELLYTFMLCFVALAMRVRKEEERIHHFGIATGFVMIAGLYGGGAISHGYFNPAVVLGLDVPKLFSGGFGWSLIYIVFQMVGAVLAVLLFRVVRPEDCGAAMNGHGCCSCCTSAHLQLRDRSDA